MIAVAGGALFINSPSVIAQQFAIFSIVAMFLSLAVLADVALRDAATRMDPIMRSMPVRAGWYFGARFAGAYAVACLGYLGVVFGTVLAPLMPWITGERGRSVSARRLPRRRWRSWRCRTCW